MRSLVFRLGSTVLVAGFAFAAVVLLWADRGALIGDRVLTLVAALGRRAEAASGLDLIDRADVPGTADQIGHVTLWAVGTLCVGIARFRRRTPLRVVAGMALISLAFEVLQPFVSTNRGFEASDARANLVGVMIGGLLVAGAAMQVPSSRVTDPR